jgi:threonine dehydratase
MLSIEKVKDASSVLSGVARRTDVLLSNGLSPGCELWLKTENLQRTGSFKLRGAYYKMSRLSESERARGIVACSAGNHAQGVALAAQKFGIKATIFLPSSAPISKIEATRRYGVEIRLSDGNYDDAYAEALAFGEKTGAVFIHPFDDEDVIAGQATIGLELIEQLPDADAVIVPVGGGGLLAGIAYTVKTLKPECLVFGVQAAGADSMYRSICECKYCLRPSVSTFSDGIAVKAPGKLTYKLCSDYVDRMVTVTDDETATAILALMEKQKLVAEGAGAVAVAAAMFGKLPIENKKVCAVISGGNIDVNILSRVINRGLLTSGRLTNLTISLIDKPGQLKKVSAIIADLGANVIHVQYSPGGENMDINGCYIRISMETRDFKHLESIKNALMENGFMLCDAM